MFGCLCTGSSNYGFDLSHIEIEEEDDAFPIYYHGLKCVSCQRLNAWKTIICDRHAQYMAFVLESYDRIPIEVYEFLKRKNEHYWLGVIYSTKLSIVEKNKKAIAALIELGAYNSHMTKEEYISRWKDPLQYLTGRSI